MKCEISLRLGSASNVSVNQLLCHLWIVSVISSHGPMGMDARTVPTVDRRPDILVARINLERKLGVGTLLNRTNHRLET